MVSAFITQILQFLMDLGYIGIALGLMIEIIPSELVLSYAGYLVSQGEITFIGAVTAGVIGGVIAQWFLYWLGYYGGRPIVEKYGKYILIKPKHLHFAEDWFSRYGSGVIFAARFVPIVRHAISIPAGLAKMSFHKFTFYTVIAIVPWSIMFIYLGEKLGSHWQDIKSYVAPYTPFIISLAFVFLVLYITIHVYKKNKK